jgi:hypothetical protein
MIHTLYSKTFLYFRRCVFQLLCKFHLCVSFMRFIHASTTSANTASSSSKCFKSFKGRKKFDVKSMFESVYREQIWRHLKFSKKLASNRISKISYLRQMEQHWCKNIISTLFSSLNSKLSTVLSLNKIKQWLLISNVRDYKFKTLQILEGIDSLHPYNPYFIHSGLSHLV